MKQARYLYKLGIVVTDDVIQAAAKRDKLPIDGALIVRLQKPLHCVFISFGLGGVALPDQGLCVVGDSWNGVTKDERHAMSALMYALDFELKLPLRMQWFLIDMVATEAKILKNPTDAEIANIPRASAALKTDDRAKYKLLARIVRRRTTAGALLPDGHEDDSDKDPIMKYFDDMIEREERSESAHKKRLGDYPDTRWGRAMAKRHPPKMARRCPSKSVTDPSGTRRPENLFGDTSSEDEGGQTKLESLPPQCQCISPQWQPTELQNCSIKDLATKAAAVLTLFVDAKEEDEAKDCGKEDDCISSCDYEDAPTDFL